MRTEFQSTLSLRRATIALPLPATLSRLFQSTLSLRRATRRGQLDHHRRGISIHALLAESDHPFADLPGTKNISIHALLAESDFAGLLAQAHPDISIHALLAESDDYRPGRGIPGQYFNPRSPCGERRYTVMLQHPDIYISIHALLAESDNSPASRCWYSLISIHALLAESDPARSGPGAAVPDFNPRSPCGERLRPLLHPH